METVIYAILFAVIYAALVILVLAIANVWNRISKIESSVSEIGNGIKKITATLEVLVENNKAALEKIKQNG